MPKNYTISLDIGTTSVGWAVLDHFALAKAKKKITDIETNSLFKKRTNLWGVYLFEEATTAETRRLKRGMRRRLLRRAKRIDYLQAFFDEAIAAVDPGFFYRLDNAFLGDTPPLFKDVADEKAHHDAYPTIYHLRNHLMTNTDKADIRLVYLALHHIVKYRGHFVNQGQTFDLTNVGVVPALKYALQPALEQIDKGLSTPDFEQINTVLTHRQWSKSKKVFETRTDGWEKALYTAMVGNGIDLAKIFDNPDYSPKANEDIPKASEFKYSLEKYEEKLAVLETILTDAELEVIIAGKQVYESIVLSGILRNPKGLSASMVDSYDLHKKQLTDLKQHAKTALSSKDYHKLFADQTGLYAQYANHNNPQKVMTREDFYKALKKLLSIEHKVKDGQTLADVAPELPSLLHGIWEAMAFETYLPKQRTNQNGAIPYQIHEHELETILNNQKAHYPFLGKLQDGTQPHDTRKNPYHLQTLFRFRIPYYVGPLALHPQPKKHNHWLAKTPGHETTKITPWNFDTVVDTDTSATHFIERMTAFCTYLPHEKVLPDSSLTYQQFKIYNELMSCGYEEAGQRHYFNHKQKALMVEELFKKERTVTAQKMVAFLHCHGITTSELSVKALFGIDTVPRSPKYNNSYSTWIELTKAGIPSELIETHWDKCEEIIKWATIFEDKTILKRTLEKANTQWQVFTEDQLKALAKLRFRGWGRLSRKLLTGIRHSNGKSILENLQTESYHNFMRLLEDPAISQAIAKEQLSEKDPTRLNYKLVADLAGSPALKKGIWSSLKIIAELEQVLGRENIGKIVIEMARGSQGGRTTTRQKQIEKFYQSFASKTNQDIDSELRSEFAAKSEKDFSNERLFLYFLQNGKCMYSGQDLNIGDLSSYEVDHIIPQSYLKDDSFENKVLVLKQANQNKGGDVPNQDIVRHMGDYWELLSKNGQVSPKKLANLRRGKLSDETKEGFINRQLVETRQITKQVANILTTYFAQTEIEVLTPKAGLTSQFRKGDIHVKGAKEPEKLHHGFPKNRDINDHHHAHDAYLNAVVATYVYNTRPDLKEKWVYGQYSRKPEQTDQKIDKQLLAGMLADDWVDQTSGKVFATKTKVLETISQTLSYRNVNVVKKTELKTGKFGKETVYPAEGKNTKATAVNRSLDPAKYGGTKSPISAHAVIVRHKKGDIKALSISAMRASQYQQAIDKLAYLQAIYPKEKITEVLVPRVDKFTKYRLPKGAYRLVASSAEARPSLQIKSFTLPDKDASEKAFITTYHHLVNFIGTNALFREAKIALMKTVVHDNFILADADTKLKLISELVRVINGSNQRLKTLSELGFGTKKQQLESGNTITTDTTLIYQSPTGLYETHRRLH